MSCCCNWSPRAGVRSSSLLTLAVLGLILLAALPARAQNTCSSATFVVIGTPFISTNATAPGDGIFGLCAPTSKAAWHLFTPTVTGSHTISLCGSSIDTVATLYNSCGGQILACDDNTCGNASLIVAQLTAGTTYYLRVASQGSTPGGFYTLNITAPASTPPQNNNCGTTGTLPANTVVRSTNLGAFGSDQSSCGILDTTDVWFGFIPSVTGMHRVEVCAPGFSPVVSHHNSCIGGVSSECAVDVAVSGCSGAGAALDFPAVAGQTTFLRVAGQRGSFGSFDIAVYTPRFNDLCENAAQLTVNVPFQGSTTPIVGTEATVPCSPSQRDVWHSFVPPATGVYTVSTCSSAFDTVLSVHGACPSQPGSQSIACNDDFCSRQSQLDVSLIGGVTYYVRVAGKNTSTAWGAYTLLVSQQAAANDNCQSAFVLPLATPTNGTTLAATGTDITSCGLLDSKDVWFTFTPPATAAYEMHTCGSVMDTTLSIFTSCFSTNAIACNDNDPAFCGNASSASRVTATLSAGATYLVRVAGASGSEGNFALTAARTPPVNGTCSTAQVLPPSTLIAGTMTGDSPSVGLASCGVPDGPDVWFNFTPTASRFWRFDTCGSVLNGVLTLYPTCPPSTPIACSASPSPSCTGASQGVALTAFLQAGTTYRLRVGGNPSSTVGTAFQLIALPVSPPNDDCQNAQTLQLDTPTVGSNAGAVPSASKAFCAVNDTRDVWFTFAAPRSGTYQFNTCAAGATFDTVLSLHPACGEALVTCSNDVPNCGTLGARVVYRLIGGQKYLVRVAGNNNSEGTFVLTAAYAPPLNDTCATAQGVNEGEVPFDTLAATTDPVFLDQSCNVGFNLVNNDVWFRYVPLLTGPVTVSTCGADFDTAIAVSSGSSGCPTGLYSVLACNDDFACFGGSSVLTPQSQVTLNGVAGTPYLIRVGSRIGATGAGSLRITGLPACRCDWNRTGLLTVDDLFAFVADWFANRGDFNNDLQTTFQDLLDFLSCYFSHPAGCQ